VFETLVELKGVSYGFSSIIPVPIVWYSTQEVRKPENIVQYNNYKMDRDFQASIIHENTTKT